MLDIHTKPLTHIMKELLAIFCNFSNFQSGPVGPILARFGPKVDTRYGSQFLELRNCNSNSNSNSGIGIGIDFFGTKGIGIGIAIKMTKFLFNSFSIPFNSFTFLLSNYMNSSTCWSPPHAVSNDYSS